MRTNLFILALEKQNIIKKEKKKKLKLKRINSTTSSNLQRKLTFVMFFTTFFSFHRGSVSFIFIFILLWRHSSSFTEEHQQPRFHLPSGRYSFLLHVGKMGPARQIQPSLPSSAALVPARQLNALPTFINTDQMGSTIQFTISSFFWPNNGPILPSISSSNELTNSNICSTSLTIIYEKFQLKSDLCQSQF